VSAPPDKPAPEPRGLERGETVGRFVLIGLLGRGGMGEVYAAYDPELDRKVAVKLLRARSSDGEARLLREAQAIAKLQHPNVVVVYDVGKWHDTVFIAMEFVDGHTLGYWMNAERRPWRETLRLYQAAGRGLEAAHALGMVHRDFKPDNVMLTKDGQVRVMDFGLARQVGETDADVARKTGSVAVPPADVDPEATMPIGKGATAVAAAASMNVSSSSGLLSLKLTQTGAQIGTPAYMAPEQFAAKPSDARTDQFSFCVALYEALYSERPFAGDSMLALMTAVLQGEVRPAPEKASVPGWIRRVLLRGLSNKPEARYPSMKELLAALEADPATRRNKWLAAAGLAVVVGGLGFAASRVGAGARATCGAGGARFERVWEEGAATTPRKDAIKAAFLATGKSFAGQAYASAARALDDYVGRWTAMYRDACEATHVRGEQSSEVLDLRMACLGDRVGNVRALSDVFAKADADVVTNAVSAAGALPPLGACADVAALRAVIKPPEDPATRKRVAELRDELARVTAIRDAGNCPVAEKRGVALVEEVRKTKYRPLLAEALHLVGGLGNFCADPAVSTELEKAAYSEGAASHADAVATEAAGGAAIFLANRLSKPEAARDWLTVAHASLDRMPNPEMALGNFLSAEGIVLQAEHKAEASVAKAREAAEATTRTLGPDHYLSLTGLANIGNVLADAGRYDEAIVADRAALAASERVLGAEHPLVALEYNNACEALNRLGQHAEALALCRRAFEGWTKNAASEVHLSYARTGIGLALLGLGKPGEAIAPLEQAVATRGGEHIGAALESESRFALARALWSQPSARPRALALARQARADVASDAKAVVPIDAWLAKPGAN
jgi:tetratricopeptide (TPR) repeat protein/predicted Ser/Thr protein kinase